MNISVIICAYTLERWDELLKAVEAVQQQRLPAFETIVVIDNNAELLQRASQALQDVRVMPNEEQRGLSGARNTGVRAARGEVIAFVDEDAIPEPDWLEKLSLSYARPEVIGSGGAILPLWQAGRPAWFPEEFDWVVGCTYRGMPDSIAPVRNLIGCNMSFRREVFTQAGGFDVRMGRIGAYPVGCEETEFCIRARLKSGGGVLLYQPEARVRHQVPPARGEWRYFLRRCYAEGLSKALMSRLVGTKDGLHSERAYTLRTLPAGVLRNLGQFLRGDMGGIQRAAAILTGLAVTTSGYLSGKANPMRDFRHPEPSVERTLEGNP